MKTKKYLLSLLTIMMASLLSVSFTSCKSCDDDDDPELSVDKTSIPLQANGDGDKDISVNASHTDWTATVTEGGTWLRVNKNGQLASVSVDPNTSEERRIGKIKITATEDANLNYVITVSQEAAKFIKVNGVKDAVLSPFPGKFEGKSGIDYKETLSITSNVQWNMSGTVPDWIYVSTTNGNGNVQMTIYPKSENLTSSSREATITLVEGQGGQASASIKVTQEPGIPDIKVIPDNLVALYNQIGWELKSQGNVDKYRMLCVTEVVFNRKTEKELLEDMNTTEAEKFSDEPVFFYAKDSYGNSIRQNTTYYVCTVAYDEKDIAGEIVKTKIVTPAYTDYNNDAFVSFSDVGCNSSMFQFTITKEGFCNTYHVIYGNIPSYCANYNKVLYAFEMNYYLKNKRKHWFATNYNMEIVVDYPNNHTFTHYTSTLATNPLAVAYGWGVFSDGKLSSDLIGFSWDTSSNDTRQNNLSRGNGTPKENLVLKRSEGLRK